MTPRRIVNTAFLTVFSLIVLVPLAWLAVSSLKSNAEFFGDSIGLPRAFSLANYAAVVRQEPLLLFLRNSLFIASFSTVVGVTIASMASYAFLYAFRFRELLRAFVSFGIFLPLSSFMLPYFLIVRALGLYNTVWGISLVYIGITVPLAFINVSSYMRVIVQSEILEAALMDGAGYHRTFASIVLPVSLRGVSTAAIFLVMSFWNELLYALLLSQSESSRTIQVAISFLVANYAADFPQAFAAMIIAIAPMIALYAFLNRTIVSGLGMAAILK